MAKAGGLVDGAIAATVVFALVKVVDIIQEKTGISIPS